MIKNFILAILAAAQPAFAAHVRLPAAAAPRVSLPIPIAPAAGLAGAAAVAPAALPRLDSNPVGAALSAVPSLDNRASGQPSAQPAAVEQLGRIAACSFDWDDNITGPAFPTKTILFKKGGLEELAVGTADFALIRGKVGSDYVFRDVNLKDYEIRRTGTSSSFRHFRDSDDGRNQFLEDLRFAVEKIPKSGWQGPSWQAFVHALNDPELASQAAIITARGHSPESMMEGLKYLQSLGAIKYLPSIENLVLVGNASDPSAEKVKAQMRRLDAIQAIPVGTDANRIVNSNGTAKAAVHSAGFSDDDWGNFSAMRDGLAAAIRQDAQRWSKIKIVLFYTGGNDPTHASRAVVLRADGTTRPLTADEQGEAFVRHLDPSARPAPRYKPLPDPIEVRSPLASADQAIKGMFVSHAYGNDAAGVIDGDDLLARERGAILDFIADASLPNERKHIILARYSIDDTELAKALVKAKDAGIKVSLITDFNVSMEYAFKEGEKRLSDYSQAKLKDDPPGRFIQALLDGGFEIVGGESKSQPRAAIYSQPLYNKGDEKMDPIMHEKSLIFVAEPAPGTQDAEKVLAYYFGTANLTAHPRYNRLFLLDEPLSAAYGLDHAIKIMQAFREGKVISDLDGIQPHRVWFEDDSFMESAYTNGKYNPNDRIVRIFERAVQGQLKIKGVTFSQFVLTNSNVVSSLKEAMKAQPLFRVFGVFDDKFVPVNGYGKAAVMNGFMTAPPMGKSSWGWPADLVKRTTLLDYLRGVDGQVETDMEGPPLARHLWHDKTTVIEVEEDGKNWVYVFTGSMNNSNHVDNAELQMMFRLPADSPWAKAVVDSVVKTAAREKEYAIPLLFGVLRDAIGAVAGLSPLYVTQKTVDAVIKAAGTADLADAVSQFKALIEEGQRLIGDKYLPKQAMERFQRFADFLSWYNGERQAGRLKSPLTIKGLVALGTVVANPAMNPYTIKSQLNQALWERDLTDPELDSRIAAAWKVLGIEGAMPAR